MRQFGVPSAIIASHFFAEESVVTWAEVKGDDGKSWAEVAVSTPCLSSLFCC